MHVAIKPKIMYFGTPVVLISTLNEEYMNDKINLQRQMGRMNNEETRRRIVFTLFLGMVLFFTLNMLPTRSVGKLAQVTMSF